MNYFFCCHNVYYTKKEGKVALNTFCFYMIDNNVFSSRLNKKTPMEKYMLSFPIEEEPYCGIICSLMDKISVLTGRPPLYEKLYPHITFHRPISGIDESVIKKITEGSILTHLRQTRISISSIHHFGKQYIVLPVNATRAIADFWVNLSSLLSQIPEYEHGLYDYDNTLHITLAEKTHEIFDSIWGEVRTISFDL